MSHLVPMRMKTEVCAVFSLNSFFFFFFFGSQSCGNHWEWREISDRMVLAF